MCQTERYIVLYCLFGIYSWKSYSTWYWARGNTAVGVQHLQKRGWVFIENLIENTSWLNELIAFESLSSYGHQNTSTQSIVHDFRRLLNISFSIFVNSSAADLDLGFLYLNLYVSEMWCFKSGDTSCLVIGIDSAGRVYLTSISNQSATLLQEPRVYIILSILWFTAALTPRMFKQPNKLKWLSLIWKGSKNWKTIYPCRKSNEFWHVLVLVSVHSL